jgi:hypothetical protein
MKGKIRPISAGRGWPLYGDEYGRMKFNNLPLSAVQMKPQAAL